VKWNRERNVETFLGCDNDYEDSRIVVFGAPFDSTSSFRPGSRFAPKAMRTDSWGLETYSPYQDRDLDFIPIFDGGDLELPFGDTELALKQIEDFVEGLADDGKLPFMIGGEHLVTLGAVKALAKQHEGLNIIHFDAHTDLRNNYLGVELSHATVMRRVWEIVGDGSIHQFGIRSGTRDEFLWAEEHTKLRKFGFGGLAKRLRNYAESPCMLQSTLTCWTRRSFRVRERRSRAGSGLCSFWTR